MQHQLAVVQTAVAGSDLHLAATQTTFLRNVLMRVPEYRQSLKAIKAAPEKKPSRLLTFLRVESPVFKPAPADTTLTFNPQPVANLGNGRWNWIGAIPLGSAGAPAVAVANGHEVQLSSGATIPFPVDPPACPHCPKESFPSISTTTSRPIWCLQARAESGCSRRTAPVLFANVTPQAKLPKSVANAPYTGAWAVDIEADGDLDIVLGAAAAFRRF